MGLFDGITNFGFGLYAQSFNESEDSHIQRLRMSQMMGQQQYANSFPSCKKCNNILVKDRNVSDGAVYFYCDTCLSKNMQNSIEGEFEVLNEIKKLEKK